MNILSIIQAGNLALAFLVPTIELALKVKHLLELDPDIQVNITNLAGAAISADEETQRIIAEWKQRQGLA